MTQERLGLHHQMFLQGIMCKQVAAGSEIKLMFIKSCEQNKVRIDLNNVSRELVPFVKTINQNIHQFGMELRKGICEIDGTHYYLLVNTVENSTLGKLATDYSQLELEFFNKLLERIVEAEDGRISSTEALNLTDGLKGKMTKAHAQQLLEKFALHKWLNVDRNVCLGVHTLVELDEYLKRMYPDNVLTCSMCKLIVINGHSCAHCFVKFHKHCLTRFFQGKDVKTCPSCKENWPNAETLAQRAVPARRGKARQSSSQNNSQRN